MPNMWKLVGSWYVPDPSPVCNKQKWFGFGKFLVLALITMGSTNPVSPVLIYVLLVRSQGIADPLDAMHLSLKFIKEIDKVQAPMDDHRSRPGLEAAAQSSSHTALADDHWPGN